MFKGRDSKKIDELKKDIKRNLLYIYDMSNTMKIMAQSIKHLSSQSEKLKSAIGILDHKIGALAQVLVQNGFDSDDFESAFSEIVESSEKLDKMVDDLIKASKNYGENKDK